MGTETLKVSQRPEVSDYAEHSTHEGYEEYALATQTPTNLLPSVCGNHYCKKTIVNSTNVNSHNLT